MKKQLLTVLFSIVILAKVAIPQTISCTDLLNYIVENGYRKSTIYSYTLDSSWLKEVIAYSLEGKIYVVAKIKQDEYGFSTSNYIFCGIPELNWRNFEYGGYGEAKSYGERFHQYIRNYECNCD